jgi:cell division protein FtsB
MHRRKTRSRQFLVALTCCGALGYFALYAIHGRHGLERRAQLMDRSAIAEREITRLETVRSRLDRDVALLGTNPPDPDLVEELALDLLGFVRPGDLLLVNPRQAP